MLMANLICISNYKCDWSSVYILISLLNFLLYFSYSYSLTIFKAWVFCHLSAVLLVYSLQISFHRLLFGHIAFCGTEILNVVRPISDLSFWNLILKILLQSEIVKLFCIFFCYFYSFIFTFIFFIQSGIYFLVRYKVKI